MNTNNVKPLSRKAINSIANTGYLNVWEGAVRSAKTVASSLAWIVYVTTSHEKYFLMTGKTNATLYRNVISGDFGLLAILGDKAEYKTDSEGNRVLLIRSDNGDIKTCYCIGGNDERSFTKARGLTVAGWYADEVNLQPKSFIEEAFRRTLVSTDRKHFWTLNPDNPNHFIYTDFIDKYEKENLTGFYLWHFTLDDNYAISAERKEELKKQYTGIFYRRFILGERCLAEGVIYDMFCIDDNTYDDSTIPEGLKRNAERYIAVDYGTTNPCVFLDIYDDGDTIWVDNEYYWDSKVQGRQKTDSEYGADMINFMGNGGVHCAVVCDPSAASFIAELKSKDIYVIPANNAVIEGIRNTATLIAKRKIKVHRERCAGIITDAGVYSWDERSALSGNEKPVKANDHRLDALRYHVMTILPNWRINE